MKYIAVLVAFTSMGGYPQLAQDSVPVAQAYWASQGVTGACTSRLTFRIVPTTLGGATAIGWGDQDACLVEIQRRFTRDEWRYMRSMAHGTKGDRRAAVQATAEVCGAVVHEVGHTLGREHTPTVTIMSPYLEDWSTVIPAGCYRLARRYVTSWTRAHR